MKLRNVLILLLLLFVTTQCATKRQFKAMWRSPYNIEIENLGVGSDGTKLVKAWANAKNPEQAVAKAEKNAVAAIIFKGLPSGNGAASTPAICNDQNALEKHKTFFENFFQTGGKYLQFVNRTNDGMPGGKDRIKMEKGYKIAVKASIAYDNLREYLEEQKIVKPMDAGF